MRQAEWNVQYCKKRNNRFHRKLPLVGTIDLISGITALQQPLLRAEAFADSLAAIALEGLRTLSRKS